MKKWIFRIILLILIVIAVVAGIVVYEGYKLYNEAISTMSIPNKVNEIKSSKTYVYLKDLPADYKNAIISVEDRRFYDHGPIDIIGIARAIFTNITNQQFLEGGSTITQQVAKNFYFISNNNNAGVRKIAEIFVAQALEENYEKDEILELYVNSIYFGDGYYGIEEASQGYLKKSSKDMNLFESTMMAGIPNAPSVYAPTVNLDLTLSRQRKVISTMVENNYITQAQADTLIEEQKDFALP